MTLQVVSLFMHSAYVSSIKHLTELSPERASLIYLSEHPGEQPSAQSMDLEGSVRSASGLTTTPTSVSVSQIVPKRVANSLVLSRRVRLGIETLTMTSVSRSKALIVADQFSRSSADRVNLMGS
jgi:hypothetical protein